MVCCLDALIGKSLSNEYYYIDEWEEMSVVAVSDKVAKALNTPAFSRLLGMLGLQPPSGQVGGGGGGGGRWWGVKKGPIFV